MEKEAVLDLISNDIRMLRELMHEMSKQVDNLNNPLLVQVSSIIDVKLNQQHKLRENNQVNAL